MTVIESIKQVSESLPPAKQQQVLKFARSLAPQRVARSKVRSDEKVLSVDPRTLHPALRAIAGMWKDRTDLPKDPVQAVKVLRSRMKSRGRNG